MVFPAKREKINTQIEESSRHIPNNYPAGFVVLEM